MLLFQFFVGCAVVSVFGSLREIGSFFVLAGKFYYDRKKSSSRVSGGLCCCVSFVITTKKI